MVIVRSISSIGSTEISYANRAARTRYTTSSTSWFAAPSASPVIPPIRRVKYRPASQVTTTDATTTATERQRMATATMTNERALAATNWIVVTPPAKGLPALD